MSDSSVLVPQSRPSAYHPTSPSAKPIEGNAAKATDPHRKSLVLTWISSKSWPRGSDITFAVGIHGDIQAEWDAAIQSLKGLPHVTDIRTIGLIAGIELASRDGAPGTRAYDVFVDCFETGLLIRVTGDIIALSPPLVIEPNQIGEIVERLGRAIEAAA